MRLKILLVILSFLMTISGCASGSKNVVEGMQSNSQEESLESTNETSEEILKNRFLTFEEAEKINGYICLAGRKLVALTDDGTVKVYNGADSEPAYNQELQQYDRSSAMKVIVNSVDDSFILIGGDGKAVGILDGKYEYPNISGVLSATFDEVNLNGIIPHLNVLCDDGTVWSSRFSTDPSARIDGISDVKHMTSSKSGLMFTFEDGTVETWDGSTRADYMIEDIHDWTDIQMAIWDEYTIPGTTDEVGYFAAGLKENGTVVATGVYSDYVKDWKDIVWIDSGRGIIAGLTADGKVLVAGHNAENTIYVNRTNKTTSDPTQWENIVAIDVGGYMGGMVGLTSEGEILGAFGGSEGETGIVPIQ